MQMTATRIDANVPVTVLAFSGDLDGSSYQDAIDRAKALYSQGTRHLVLDLGGVPYISSAGIVALVTIASILRGATYVDPEHGWSALHSIERAAEGGTEKNLKLLNLQPRVAQVLEATGLKNYLEVYTDMD